MILEQTDEDTKPIPHRGPKANLVGLGAIMSRNWDLPYPESLFLKLDEDLRVKMKLIRALFKGYLARGFAGIGPKAGVVFGHDKNADAFHTCFLLWSLARWLRR